MKSSLRFGELVSEETRIKISLANKKRSEDPEFIKRMSESCKKVKSLILEENRLILNRKISETLRKNNKNHVQSPETKAKISELAKNRFLDPKERLKCSRTWTDEEKENWGSIQKNKWTPEMRENISLKNKGKIPWNKRLECGHIYRDKCLC